MILPYIGVAGGELFNAARTVGYLRNITNINLARLSGLWELAAVDEWPCNRLTFGPLGISEPLSFTDPLSDWEETGRPTWVNPEFPESVEFLGAIITDIVGLSPTPVRQLSERPLGGKLGNQRRMPRTITVKGYLVGSPCGIAYGARWFNDWVRTGPCLGCQSYTFEFYKGCPTDNARWGTPYYDGYWIVENAGLSSGMKVTPVHARDLGDSNLAEAGCDLAAFEFSIAAGNPYLYKPFGQEQPAGEDGSIAFTFTPPPIGVDGLVVFWGDATAGTIARADGDMETFFSFADAPLNPGDSSNFVTYDSSTHRFTVDDFVGIDIIPPDGAAYITGIDPGFLFTWVEVGECVTDPINLVITGDGSYVQAFIRHREG